MKIELAIRRKGYIISKIIYSIFALFLTVGIFFTLKELFLRYLINLKNIFSLNFVLALIILLVFCLIDYLIIKSIIMSKMLYYDDSGIIAGGKKIAWEMIADVKLTFGQFPVLKIAYQENANLKKMVGLTRAYPSKNYLNSVKEIFQNRGIMVRKSFI